MGWNLLLSHVFIISLIIIIVPLTCSLGCCCDSRRAVIIYCILYVIFDVIAIALVVMNTNANTYYKASLAILGVSLVMRIISSFGALFYNKWMVGIGAIWTVISAILRIVMAFIRPTYSVTHINSINGSSVITHYSLELWQASPIFTTIWTLVWGALLFYVSCYCFNLNSISTNTYTHLIIPNVFLFSCS